MCQWASDTGIGGGGGVFKKIVGLSILNIITEEYLAQTRRQAWEQILNIHTHFMFHF